MKKEILLLVGIILVFSLSFSYAVSNRFSDVLDSHWANEAIKVLNDYGIINGYPDGTFKPDNTISRAEFAKLIVSVLNLDTSAAKDTNYSDVSKTHWAYKYIKTISPLLPTSKSSKFYPDEPIIRQDVATAIINAVEWENKEYNQKTIEKFTDSELISGDYQKYIAIAVENELMNGNADGSFNPKGNLTRAEVAQLVYNIYIKFRHLHFEQYDVTSTNDNSIEIPKDVLNTSGTNYFDETEYVKNGQTIVQRVGKINDDVFNVEYARTNSSSTNYHNASLDIVLNNTLLKDEGKYSLNRNEKIYAFINNASTTSSIYYMFSYGNKVQTTTLQKISNSVAIITVPTDVPASNLKLHIWGETTKNGKKYYTNTETIYFNYTNIPVVEEAQYSLIDSNDLVNDEVNNSSVTKDIDFIVIFNADTYKNDATLFNAKADQKIIVRGKPVSNIKSIRYRWDDGMVEYEESSTATISIPKTYKTGSSHKLTIIAVGKDGSISEQRTYTVEISEAY